MQEEIVEHGTVINSSDEFLEIQLDENDNCHDCSAKLFCNPQKDSSKILKVKNNSTYNTGDKVSITILGKSILLASFNLYLYPLLVLVFSIYIGTKIFSDSANFEIYSFFIALILVTLYYSLFYLLSKRTKKSEPRIVISKL